MRKFHRPEGSKSLAHHQPVLSLRFAPEPSEDSLSWFSEQNVATDWKFDQQFNESYFLALSWIEASKVERYDSAYVDLKERR